VRPEIPQGKSHADEQHTLTFGGSYKSGALRMMKELNAWAEEQEQAKDQ
jgi:hypothetical protein